MMKYFPYRHKLQQFEGGLKCTACFKTFQVILHSELSVFQMPDMLVRQEIKMSILQGLKQCNK